MQCPHCHSADIHPSQSGNARMPLLLRPLLVVLRCYKCEVRFSRPRLLRLIGNLLPQGR